MSLSIEELIISAKKLANRLKDDELKADVLISQTKSTFDQVEAMKQYSDDVEKLNEAASQRPYSVLVAGLQRESQHLRELQAENCELRNALRDHQNAIELIMSKYRQQISKLMNKNKVDPKALNNTMGCTNVILSQYNQMDKMKNIMREAAEAEEESSIKDHELITRLITENKGLREVLNIYRKYGSSESLMERKQDYKSEMPNTNDSASQEKVNEEKMNSSTSQNNGNLSSIQSQEPTGSV